MVHSCEGAESWAEHTGNAFAWELLLLETPKKNQVCRQQRWRLEDNSRVELTQAVFAESSLMNFTDCPSWALQWLQLCNSLRRLSLLLIDHLSVLLGVPSYSITQLSSVLGKQWKISCGQEVNADIFGHSKLSHTKLSLCAKSTSCCAPCESQKSQKGVKEGTSEAPLESITRKASLWCSSFGAPFLSR